MRNDREVERARPAYEPGKAVRAMREQRAWTRTLEVRLTPRVPAA
jgi:hypothetical protein